MTLTAHHWPSGGAGAKMPPGARHDRRGAAEAPAGDRNGRHTRMPFNDKQ